MLAFGDTHLGVPGIFEAEFSGAGRGQIKNAPLDEWPAIIDADSDDLAIFLVFDFELSAKRQCTVGSRHGVRVHHFAIGCGVANIVPRGAAAFIVCSMAW